ncbi:hypothetical protein [uncultured Cellulomonas sp.]|uniref:hypothetical protein n=1 Tax=uncultured Cellulomonas sp. TaxID=189682 RepID=UPI0028EBA3D0|nr:hypothetical protein [uncultured Cellulomonas sp.]
MLRTAHRRGLLARAAASVTAVLAIGVLAAGPAAAATGTSHDELDDAYSFGTGGYVYGHPTADIVRTALRLDGSVVQATVYLAELDAAWADQTFVDASIDTDGDGEPNFSLTKYRPWDDNPGTIDDQLDGEAVVQAWTYHPDGTRSVEVVPDCPLTVSASAASRSLSLSATASCLGSPASARMRLDVFVDDGTRPTSSM